MIAFDMNRLIPRFLMHDRNGLALAKGMEAALLALTNTVKAGVDILSEVDAMPEWRLDELAWEYNCLYDFTGAIAEKRKWIRKAMPVYRVYGTVQAIYSYLEGVFDSVEVEENWQYSGDPYHFRITATGEWTDAKEKWAMLSVQTAKNVRSVFDGFAIGSHTNLEIDTEAKAAVKFPYPMAGENQLCGGDGL